MFGGLDDAQWATQSLCSEWTVRDVAGHLITPMCVSTPRFALGAVTSGGFSRYSVKVARRLAARPAAELVRTRHDQADQRFTPPGLGPLAPLTDITVHTRDAARPLGLDTTAPLPVWTAVLDFLTSDQVRPIFVPRGRLTGLHFRATDQPWESGQGPEVEGPSEALAMAVVGRSVALADLSGDGVPVLAARSG